MKRVAELPSVFTREMDPVFFAMGLLFASLLSPPLTRELASSAPRMLTAIFLSFFYISLALLGCLFSNPQEIYRKRIARSMLHPAWAMQMHFSYSLISRFRSPPAIGLRTNHGRHGQPMEHVLP
jgi:hypothetical protein